MAGFEVSSIYVGGLKKALEPLQLTPAERATMSEVAREALASPNAQRWFPGEVMFAALECVAAHRGFKAVTEVNVAVSSGPLLTVVGPLLRVALAFAKSPVTAAMTRLQQISTSALKNVAFDWKETSPSTGELTVTYETAQIPHQLLEHAWRGVFHAMSTVMGVELRLEKSAVVAPNAVGLHFAW